MLSVIPHSISSIIHHLINTMSAPFTNRLVHARWHAPLGLLGGVLLYLPYEYMRYKETNVTILGLYKRKFTQIAAKWNASAPEEEQGKGETEVQKE